MYVFSLLAKVCRETDVERMLAGKLFHTRGPATAKLHVPRTVLVLWTTRHRLSADRRCRLPASVVTGTQSSARYGGAGPCGHLLTIVANLYAVAALHQGAPCQMTWLEGPPPSPGSALPTPAYKNVTISDRFICFIWRWNGVGGLCFEGDN